MEIHYKKNKKSPTEVFFLLLPFSFTSLRECIEYLHSFNAWVNSILILFKEKREEKEKKTKDFFLSPTHSLFMFHLSFYRHHEKEAHVYWNFFFLLLFLFLSFQASQLCCFHFGECLSACREPSFLLNRYIIAQLNENIKKKDSPE